MENKIKKIIIGTCLVIVSCILVLAQGCGQVTSSGTYTISGSTITFTATTGYDIGSRDATLSGNVLTLSS